MRNAKQAGLLFFLLLLLLAPSVAFAVDIQWLGHSSFKFTFSGSQVLLTDPFDDTLGYPIPKKKKLVPDVVLVSNDHFDHNDVKRLKGHPLILREEGATKYFDIRFTGIKSFADQENGLKRGENIIFTWRWEGINFCFLGELAQPLSKEQVKKIGKVDVLFIPVGGTYTLDATEARQVILQLNPSVIFPMHFRTEALNANWISLDTEEPFLREIKSAKIRKINSDRIKLTSQTLPKKGMEIILLQYPKKTKS